MNRIELDTDSVENLLDYIVLTSSEIERQISSHPLEFDSYRDPHSEWMASIPRFIDSFYPFVMDECRIPTQLEMWERYREGVDDCLDTRGIRSRMFRAYPSLVRDLHMSILLSERSKNSDIIYNRMLDFTFGIDILILFMGRAYSVNLYTETSRSHKGRSKKKARHITFSNVTPIDLPLYMEDGHRSGRFILYGDRDIDRLIGKIRKTWT